MINQKLHQVVDHLNQRRLAKVSGQGDTQPKTMASQSRRRAEPLKETPEPDSMYARTKNKKRTRDYFEGREDSRGRSRHRGEEVWNQGVIIQAYEQMNQLHQKNLKRLKTNGNMRSNAKSRGRSGTRAASKKASRKPSRKSSRRDYDVSDDDEIITLHQFPQVSQVRKTTGTKPDRGRKEESPSPLVRESSKDRRTATEVCT